jgi:hypothetical protein
MQPCRSIFIAPSAGRQCRAASRTAQDAGLQLVAQATPSVHVEGPRFAVWKVALVTLACFAALAIILDNTQKPGPAAASSDNYHRYSAAVQAINTPATFQAHCGKAARVENLGSSNYAPGTVRLLYQARPGEFHVYFSDGRLSGIESLEGGHAYFFRDTEDHPGTVDALRALGCPVAP